MSMCRRLPCRICSPHLRLQRGAALLLMLAILVLVGVTLFLQESNRTALRLENERQTAAALAQAKEALIAYAVTYYDRALNTTGRIPTGEYGFLPCPDWTVSAVLEGAEEGTCKARDMHIIGRLPWLSLGIEPLRDGAGECLWYAVTGLYKRGGTAKTFMLNADSAGAFRIYGSNDGNAVTQRVGATGESRAVAVIIAPGRALGGQSRVIQTGAEICGGNYTASNYLEKLTAAGINNAQLATTDTAAIVDFITTSQPLAQRTSESINDQIITITADEIFKVIQKRKEFLRNMKCMTQIAANCLANYATSTDQRLPFPAPLTLADYSDENNYIDQNIDLSGRLPNMVTFSNTATGKIASDLIKSCTYLSMLETELNECIADYDQPEFKLTQADSVDSKYLISNPLLDVDKQTLADKNFETLWKNWKDHLFYIVSEAYKPTATVTTSISCTAINCVEVGGNLYAGLVIFAGARLNGQIRRTTPDTDTKNNIANYLDQANATHSLTHGYGTYLIENSTTINDIIFCLQWNTSLAKMEVSKANCQF